MIKRLKRFAPGRGALLLAAVLLSITGYLVSDYRGVPFGFLGALLWFGALFVSFTLGTIYLSRVLLPIPGGGGWSEAFGLLWRHYLNGSPGLPNDEGERPLSLAAKLREAEGLEIAPSFDALNAGFLPSHQAASIVRGNTYSRADGPGLIFLRSGEMIGGLFDLRPHSRKQALTVNTRDGIPLKTSINVGFRVRRLTNSAEGEPALPPEQERLPYPYDRDAIFRLNYTGSIGEGNDLRSWTEQVLPTAATLLVNEVAKYELDALLDMAGAEPLGRITRDIESQLRDQFAPEGIEVTSVKVGALESPEDVVRQRLESWQAEWQLKVDQELAAGDVETLRLIQQSRARAQLEIIEDLFQNIEAMRRESSAGLHKIVTQSLVETVENVLGNEAVRSALPDELASSLDLQASNRTLADQDAPEDTDE